MRFIFSSSSVWRTSRVERQCVSSSMMGTSARAFGRSPVSDAWRRLLQAGSWVRFDRQGRRCPWWSERPSAVGEHAQRHPELLSGMRAQHAVAHGHRGLGQCNGANLA